MTFVIDTNIFVAALSRTSPHHWVIERLLSGKFGICYSNEMLLEYEEVLTLKYGEFVASNFLKALQELPNAKEVNIWYRWNIISDVDDNKFIDAAVAGGVHYIVSEDRHLRVLSSLDFPPITLLRIAEFKSLIIQP